MVNKVDVSSAYFENIFQFGLTIVSSNNIMTIKINNKKVLKITRK